MFLLSLAKDSLTQTLRLGIQHLYICILYNNTIIICIMERHAYIFHIHNCKLFISRILPNICGMVHTKEQPSDFIISILKGFHYNNCLIYTSVSNISLWKVQSL